MPRLRTRVQAAIAPGRTHSCIATYRTHRIRRAALAAATLLVLAGIGAAAAGATVSWQGLQWNDFDRAGMTATQSGDALTYVYPGTYATNNAYPVGERVSDCMVNGPFDLTVDYSFPTGVGSNSGIRAGIQMFDPASGRVIAGIYRWNEGYIGHLDGSTDSNSGGNTTAGTFEIRRETASGSMRILRSDATTGGVPQALGFRPDFNTAALKLDVFTYAAPPYPTNSGEGTPAHPSLAFTNVTFHSGSCVSPKQDQTISFAAPAGLTYLSPATELAATSSSGLPVSYSSSTPAVCRIDASNRLQVVSVGACSVTASQPGNDSYNAAASVTRQFSIAPAMLSVDADDQVISYGGATPPPTYALTGFATGEDAGSADVTGVASCSVAATAGPDAGSYPGAISCTPGSLTAPNYTFVAGSTGDLTVLRAAQTISFDQPAELRIGDADAVLTATATSGLAVAFSSSTPGTCAIVEGKLHALAAGTCTIVASQLGNTNYEPAPLVDRSVAIDADADPPVISVPHDITIDATAPSGATVSYSASASDAVDPAPTLTCTPGSGTVFPIGTTTVTCMASDTAGNRVSRSFNVTVRGAGAQIVGLIDKTMLFLDLPALRTSLRSGLESAANALAANHKPAVCTALNAYVLAVRIAPQTAFSSSEKAELVADATRIRAVIAC